MLRRGLLVGVVAFLVLCIVGLAVTWFVYLPRAQEEIAGEFEAGIAAETARAVAAGPGVTVITDAALTASLNAALTPAENEEDRITGIVVTTTPGQFAIAADFGPNPVGYTGTPIAEDGQLVLSDFAATNQASDLVLPADTLARALERGVNDALAAASLELDTVETGQGQITFTTRPAT